MFHHFEDIASFDTYICRPFFTSIVQNSREHTMRTLSVCVCLSSSSYTLDLSGYTLSHGRTLSSIPYFSLCTLARPLSLTRYSHAHYTFRCVVPATPPGLSIDLQSAFPPHYSTAWTGKGWVGGACPAKIWPFTGAKMLDMRHEYDVVPSGSGRVSSVHRLLSVRFLFKVIPPFFLYSGFCFRSLRHHNCSSGALEAGKCTRADRTRGDARLRQVWAFFLLFMILALLNNNFRLSSADGGISCKRCRFDRFERILKESGAEEMVCSFPFPRWGVRLTLCFSAFKKFILYDFRLIFFVFGILKVYSLRL